MKVAVVVTNFPALSETFIVNQIVELVNRNVALTILPTGHLVTEGPRHSVIERHGLMARVGTAGTVPRSPPRRILGALSRLVSLRGHRARLLSALDPFRHGRRGVNLLQFYEEAMGAHLADAEYDLVHAHFGDNGRYVDRILRETDAVGSLVVSFHGYDLADVAPGRYARLFARREARFTVNSRYTLDRALAAGAPPERTHIVPECLDTGFFRRRRPPEPRQVGDPAELLFVGRLVPFKNPVGALRIVRTLRDAGRPVRLTLVGDGPLRDACRRYVDETDLHDQVHLAGACSQDTVLDLMEAAHLFVYPGIVDARGRAENQGLVLQEAQAMELPVIVSDAGGMAEGVVDGRTGFVIPLSPEGADEAAFAERIADLLEDPRRCVEMGREGRKHVVAHFSAGPVVDALLKVYAT